MAKEPAVLSVRRGGGALELTLHVPVELDYFPGHFPRFAMLPGVVQIDWAIALAREHLPVKGAFRQLAALKFQQPILPGADVTLTLEQPAPNEIVFAYRSQARACSGGRIVFGTVGE